MTPIFLCKAGSHAYGTNTPTSDTDLRGIFVADPKFIRTPYHTINEYRDPKEKDSVSYELNKFVQLYTDCNPNIVEFLWMDDSDILVTSPAYELLRKHRYELLSSKAAFTFSSYGLSQLKQMKNQSKWENNPQPIEPPRQTKYVSLIVNYTDEKIFNINIEDYGDGYQLVHYGSNIYGIYKSESHRTFSKKYTLNMNSEHFEHTDSEGNRRIPLFIVKFNIDEYKKDLDIWTNYWEWRNLKDKKVRLYELIEIELANRTVDGTASYHGIDAVMKCDDMDSLVKTLSTENLTDHLHLCKRHFDFKANSIDCYSVDTEFLTENGWKLYDDIENSDLLVSFDPKSLKTELQPIIERVDNLYTGNMYHFIGRYQDCMVTANHRMFVRKQERNTGKIYDEWEFNEACKVPDYFEVLHHLTPKRNRTQSIPKGINHKIFDHLDIHNYLRVIGWYVSEGSASFKPNGDVYNISISQSKKGSILTQNINKLRNSGKIKCKHFTYIRDENRLMENIWVFNGEVAEIIVSECSHLSKNVHLPNWIFNLTGRELNILLTALLQGDGAKCDDGTFVYYTTSPQLADDVHRLCIMAGHAAHKLGPYKSENINHSDVYQIHIWKHPKQTKRLARYTNVKKIPVVNERTVCFMVGNGTLITRRNGKVSYHGNCKSGMHLVRIMRMCVEILRDGVVNVKRPDAKELLEIRNGKWSYDELIAYAEETDKYVREVLYPNTKLRKKPDIDLATSLILQIQDMVW